MRICDWSSDVCSSDLEGKLDIYSIYSIIDYMKAILSNNDVIVLHGLLSPFRKQLMLFVFIRLFFCKVFRKINLVAWGGGDFELRKFKLIDRLHFKLVNRINKVLTLSHADKERYEKIYRKQAIVIAYFTINVNLRETVGERVSDITKIMN